MFTLFLQFHTLCPIVECTGYVDFMCRVVPKLIEVSGLDPIKRAPVDPVFQWKLSCGFHIETFVVVPPLVAIAPMAYAPFKYETPHAAQRPLIVLETQRIL